MTDFLIKTSTTTTTTTTTSTTILTEIGRGLLKRPISYHSQHQQWRGERENKAFKYDYLEGHNHSTISGMLTILLEEFFSAKYFRYGPFFGGMKGRSRKRKRE